jgi:outer membrane protein
MNLHPKLLWLIFALLAFSGQSYAQQTATQMSLEDAINYALTETMTIKDAQINIADAEQQITERRSFGLPQLTGGVTYQRYLQVPIQPLPPTFGIFGIYGQAIGRDLFPLLEEDTQQALQQFNEANPADGGDSDGVSFFLRNNFTAALNLDAMLFDGSYFVGLKAARAYRTYVQEDFAVKKREVRNAVVDAYLPVLLIQENIELLDKNIANLDRLLFETKALYKEGFAEQLDIDRQDLSLANLRTERENLVRQKQVAMTGLKFTINYPIDQPLVITDNLDAMIFDATESDLTSNFNINSRPELMVVNRGIELNELNIKLNRSGYLPTLRAFGTYQQQYQGDNFQDGFWAPTTFIGLNLNIPIFDGLEKEAKIERARLQLEMAKNQRQNLEQAIEVEVKNARTNYISARRRYESQQKNVALAERIYNTTQIKYREGVGSSLEVTQAEQSLYTAQSNYMQGLFDLLVAKSKLDQALGK